MPALLERDPVTAPPEERAALIAISEIMDAPFDDDIQAASRMRAQLERKGPGAGIAASLKLVGPDGREATVPPSMLG